VVVFVLMYCIGPCLDVLCIGGGAYVVSPDPLWSVMAHPFSPHFKIGIALMALANCPLMLVTLHHVGHL
jgi:hypothetical protein